MIGRILMGVLLASAIAGVAHLGSKTTFRCTKGRLREERSVTMGRPQGERSAG